jgi:RNA polymerase sigma factor (sigma-70 family)
MSSLKDYLNEIARYPLLTVDQEIQYGRRIAKMRELQQLERELTTEENRLVRSGQRARERFIQCNLQLVVHVAKKYEARRRKSLEIMDLIQEGNIGLARAVELFDYSRGYKFSTYAYWWIKQGIQRALSQNDSMIRLPTGLHDLLTKIAKVHTELGHQFCRTPTLREIADRVGIDINVIYDAMQRSYAVCSLDVVPSTSDSVSLIDMIADPQSTVNYDELSISHQAQEMMDLMDKYLDDRSKFVIVNRRLQKPVSWRELESATGVSGTRLQQIERVAMLRLKLMLNKGRELHDTPLGGLG